MRRAVAMVVAGAFAVAACSSDGGGSVEAFCAGFEEVDATADPFEADDIETFNQRLDELQSASEAVTDAAPDEISEETALLLASIREQFDAFREIDDLTDQDQFEAAFEDSTFDEGEVEEANEAFESYVEEECGIVLSE